MIRVSAQLLYDADSDPLFHWRFRINNQFQEEIIVQRAKVEFVHWTGSRWRPRVKTPFPLKPLGFVKLDFWPLRDCEDYHFLDVGLALERVSQLSRLKFWLPIHESVRSASFATEMKSGKTVSSTSGELGEMGNLLSQPASKRKKIVLILGKDTGSHLLLLQEIQGLLKGKRIKSVLLKDLPDVSSESLEQKLVRIATQVSYVIVEHSHASGHIAELKTLTAIRVPTAVISQQGKGATWMQADYDLDFAFTRFFSYETLSSEFIATIDKWVSGYLRVRRHELNRRFPWR